MERISYDSAVIFSREALTTNFVNCALTAFFEYDSGIVILTENSEHTGFIPVVKIEQLKKHGVYIHAETGVDELCLNIGNIESIMNVVMVAMDLDISFDLAVKMAEKLCKEFTVIKK